MRHLSHCVNTLCPLYAEASWLGVAALPGKWIAPGIPRHDALCFVNMQSTSRSHHGALTLHIASEQVGLLQIHAPGRRPLANAAVPLGERIEPGIPRHAAPLSNSLAALVIRNGRSAAGVPLPIKDRLFRAAKELQLLQEARKCERRDYLQVLSRGP
jgi:hypothetical protein